MMVRLWLITFPVSMIALAEVPATWAQVPELDAINAEPRLLLKTDVQKHLILSDKQVEKTSALVSQFIYDIEKLQQERLERAKQVQESREKQFAKIIDRTAEIQKEIEGVLSKPQMTRLKQLSLHYRGYSVFRTPPVQKALALSDAQNEEIATAIKKGSETAPVLREFRKAFPKKTVEELRDLYKDACQAFDTSMMNRMVDVLTEEQRTKWAKMIGLPYEFGPFRD
jgi:hypothetical protein